jgi:cysteine desulfurase
VIRAYLDNNATTRLAAEALAAMMPYLTDQFLNPASTAGQILGAGDTVAEAQRELAKLFGAEDLAQSFVLTSGASEANSWVVSAASERSRIAVSAIEHPSLIAAAEAFAARGGQVDWMPVTGDGELDLAEAARRLGPDTSLVCVMAANNETGVCQPLAKVGSLVRERAPQATFHVDATQAVGRIPLDLTADLLEADTIAVSAHKFHGPKGVGALFIRPGLRLPPLIHGEQEEGRRGGTANSPAAAGVAAAARLARLNLSKMVSVASLRDRFEALLLRLHPAAQVAGSRVPRLPNTSSLIIPGLDARDAVEQLALSGICIATGSACSSGSPAPSHVLKAMGLSYADAKAALRISLSLETTWDELQATAEAISELVPIRA